MLRSNQNLEVYTQNLRIRKRSINNFFSLQSFAEKICKLQGLSKQFFRLKSSEEIFGRLQSLPEKKKKNKFQIIKLVRGGLWNTKFVREKIVGHKDCQIKFADCKACHKSTNCLAGKICRLQNMIQKICTLESLAEKISRLQSLPPKICRSQSLARKICRLQSLAGKMWRLQSHKRFSYYKVLQGKFVDYKACQLKFVDYKDQQEKFVDYNARHGRFADYKHCPRKCRLQNLSKQICRL